MVGSSSNKQENLQTRYDIVTSRDIVMSEAENMASLQPELCGAPHNTSSRHYGHRNRRTCPSLSFFFKLSKIWTLLPYNGGITGLLHFTDIRDTANLGI